MPKLAIVLILIHGFSAGRGFPALRRPGHGGDRPSGWSPRMFHFNHTCPDRATFAQASRSFQVQWIQCLPDNSFMLIASTLSPALSFFLSFRRIHAMLLPLSPPEPHHDLEINLFKPYSPLSSPIAQENMIYSLFCLHSAITKY